MQCRNQLIPTLFSFFVYLTQPSILDLKLASHNICPQNLSAAILAESLASSHFQSGFYSLSLSLSHTHTHTHTHTYPVPPSTKLGHQNDQSRLCSKMIQYAIVLLFRTCDVKYLQIHKSSNYGKDTVKNKLHRKIEDTPIKTILITNKAKFSI